MKMTVRRATEDDALSLAKRLRPADLQEIQATSGRDPKEVLLGGLETPDDVFVAVDEDDRPHVIVGTVPSGEPLLGFVWMMASEDIDRYWIWLLRETPRWVENLSGKYKVLANAVHAGNPVHIKWLKWAGFVLLREFQYNGESFYEFARLS